MEVTRPNQVWSADITYLPIARGFLYLVAIYGLVQPLCPSLASVQHPGCRLLYRGIGGALSKAKPETFNTDQGSQFTSEAFTGLLEQHGVRISMDVKGRYSDNIFVERLWRTVKYEEVYLKAYSNGREAKAELDAPSLLQHPSAAPGPGLPDTRRGVQLRLGYSARTSNKEGVVTRESIGILRRSYGTLT